MVLVFPDVLARHGRRVFRRGDEASERRDRTGDFERVAGRPHLFSATIPIRTVTTHDRPRVYSPPVRFFPERVGVVPSPQSATPSRDLVNHVRAPLPRASPPSRASSSGATDVLPEAWTTRQDDEVDAREADSNVPGTAEAPADNGWLAALHAERLKRRGLAPVMSERDAERARANERASAIASAVTGVSGGAAGVALGDARARSRNASEADATAPRVRDEWGHSIVDV